MKIGWAVGRIQLDHSCYLARVHGPHLKLLEMGVDSRVYAPEEPAEAMRDRDVVIFHRYLDKLPAASAMGLTLGFDLADDLLSSGYSRLPVDFILTDSLPNTRFYLSRQTFYWAHGFPDQTSSLLGSSGDEGTRFVYCGAPENAHCLTGPPLEALEAVGRTRPITLRIITDIRSNQETWVGGLPEIKARNFKVEWMQFEQHTHARLMQECDVGYFPQALDKPRWQKKSCFKPAHASSLGLPSISSPTEEVLMNFLDGHSALLPRDAAGWVQAVETMCNVQERARIRSNVVNLFHAHFTMDLITQQVLGIARLVHERRRSSRFRGLRRMMLNAYVQSDRILNAIERRLAAS